MSKNRSRILSAVLRYCSIERFCHLYGSIHSLFLKVTWPARRIQTVSRCDVAELNIHCTIKLNVACMTYPVSLHVYAVILYIRTWYQLIS